MQPLKNKTKIIFQLLQNCIGPSIRIGQEIQCLPYLGFFLVVRLFRIFSCAKACILDFYTEKTFL